MNTIRRSHSLESHREGSLAVLIAGFLSRRGERTRACSATHQKDISNRPVTQSWLVAQTNWASSASVVPGSSPSLDTHLPRS